MNSLAFQSTQFDVIDRNQQHWLRLHQIGVALGYSRPDAVNKIFQSNADEFTDSMTALAELDTEGGKQTIRVFSLRGCHLLAMFARTEKAKDFRKWVLYVLDNHTQPQYALKQLPEPKTKTKKALPGGLTLEQQDAIKQIVKERVAELPKDRQAGGAIRCWSAIKKKYGKTYKAVEPEHFGNLVSLLARLPLEGELLDNTTPSNTLTIKLDKNAPLQRLSLKFETTGYSFDRWFVSNSMGNVNIMPIADDVLCLTESEWIKHMTQERGYVVGKQLSRT